MIPGIRSPSGPVFLNGRFVPPDQALVPISDRGFLFGDGVYEVIPFYEGRPLGLTGHLDRLERSLDEIALRNPHTRSGWIHCLRELVARHGAGDLSVYLQVTRGAPPTREHAFPAEPTAPTVVMTAAPLKSLPDAVRLGGAAAITAEDQRWERCDIKSINLLPNVLARQKAVAAGAMEAILLRDGLANEGAASNLFIVADGALVTPPRGPHILSGITRALVLELAEEAGVPVRVAPVTEEALRRADEIWLTSSTREIMPVTRLDGKPVGEAVPGPCWRRLDACYQAYKETLTTEWDDA